MSENVLL